MKCKNCNNLYNMTDITGEKIGNWCPKINDSPDIEIERECKYCDTMTNADRIRNMTDEELAEHILSTPAYETCIKFCKNREECCEIMDMDNDVPEEWCKQCLLEWLQKEVQE